ncbi:hypothetical protein LIER_15216 [Lithospermum erythrorhizon]|uniref:Uncharacterized protein n=1 Tax=Lithospermum erythrorhizon TaxID=34254 RepID=A0AAV3Q570_LITER
MYNEFKKPLQMEYFEGLFVESPLTETLAEDAEVAEEGVEVADREATNDDEATTVNGVLPVACEGVVRNDHSTVAIPLSMPPYSLLSV